MIRALMLAGLVVLGGCSAAQVKTANDYQSMIAGACAAALPLALAPGVGMYITAGCATEQAIAQLALDPSSLAWIKDLVGKAKAVKLA